MLKKIMLAAVLATGSSLAMADNDVGCGVGSQVWAGQSGIIPKLLAGTTNVLFTNQWLGLLSVPWVVVREEQSLHKL
jgi:hypothetical protein